MGWVGAKVFVEEKSFEYLFSVPAKTPESSIESILLEHRYSLGTYQATPLADGSVQRIEHFDKELDWKALVALRDAGYGVYRNALDLI